MAGPTQTYPWIVPGIGIRRRVLADDAQLMVVEFEFEKDASGALHRHVHTQSTFVQSGVFAFTLGPETYTLHAGDSIVVPSNMAHGCVALEPGTLIDTFTPRRDDFL